MSISLKPLPQKPQLELCSIKLYSTGVRKIFTNHFYRGLNHNFGVEIKIKNNTSIIQNVRIGGCIYDSDGKTVIEWKGKLKKINPNSSNTHDFYVREDSFSKMRDGRYKIQFWVNDQKVQKEYFTISYK